MSWTGKGGAPTVDPDTGFPKPGSQGTSYSVKCRYENFAVSNRKEWTGEDGKTILQRGTIFVPFGERVPEKFENVKIVDDTDSRVEFEGNVLNVYTGQLNSTLAV